MAATPKTTQSASDETSSSQQVSPASAAAAALASAKQSGIQILIDAQQGVEKLILIATGDAEALLSEAEASAIPIILHNIPAPFSGFVAPFAQVAASKVAGAINTVVEPIILTGLGIAHNWLESVIGSATAGIERLGTKAETKAAHTS